MLLYSQKNDSSDNTETLVYSVVGGVVCCYFMPSYIPIFICVGGLIFCTYGIIKVLDKYKNIEDMNFVEKEKVECFKKK